MSLDRLDGVMRAAGIEAAVASEQRTDQVSVTAEKTDQQVAHSWSRTRFQCTDREEKSWLFGEVTARWRQRTTKSMPCRRCRCRRKLSRTTRFSRLRSTARRATFLEIAKPNRAGRWPLVHARTVKQKSTDFSGCAKTFLKSAACPRRAEHGRRVSARFPGRWSISSTGVRAPSRGAPSAPCVRCG